jgi:hypothetical protein
LADLKVEGGPKLLVPSLMAEFAAALVNLRVGGNVKTLAVKGTEHYGKIFMVCC